MFRPPTYINGRALDEWNRLLPFMTEHDFCKEEYLMTFASYCVAVMQFEEAMNQINNEGYLIEGRNESWVKNPAFTILKEANDRISQGSRAFGFTPGDMKRLNADIVSEDIPSWARGL